MSELLARRDLPDNYLINIARLRKAKEKRVALPKWLEDDHLRTRILAVYKMYLERNSLPKIMEVHSISVTQIYKDIGRARQMRLLLFQGELENLLMEQVSARRQLIVEARDSLTELRRVCNNITDADGNSLDIDTDKAQKAKAESELLKFISGEEKHVEELLGLRDKDRKTDAPQVMAQATAGVTLVIDARTNQVGTSYQEPKVEVTEDTDDLLDNIYDEVDK